MPISEKQKMILAFPYTKKYQSLICDGAVRSGKTSFMTIAFVDWAMREFNNTNFAICGKTVGSAIKNIIAPFMSLTRTKERYAVKFARIDNKMIVTSGDRVNTFYIYGGKDESSYMLIQGITLAGVLFDEVALMTRSFFEEALARCLSFPNRRYWFNCNPDNPNHWFNQGWILQAKKHRALHLHFLMSDNPTISQETIDETANMWSGVFYRRKVLGEWAIAEGAIYPMFDPDKHVVDVAPVIRRVWIGVDYGHTNPTTFLLLGEGVDNRLYTLCEYYHDSVKKGAKSPRQYSIDLMKFVRDADKYQNAFMEGIYVDPSAEGFINQLREDNVFSVRQADNRVLPGIQLVSALIEHDQFRVLRDCVNTIMELQGYSWDDKAAAQGVDKPKKINDHAMDALRYGVIADKTSWQRRLNSGRKTKVAAD